MEIDQHVREKALKIKAFVLDVDGVLTDGGILYDDNGLESKRFFAVDGMIIKVFQQHGMLTGVITGRNSQVVKNRCQELTIDFHHHGVSDKLATYEQVKETYKLADEEIAFMGDDIVDIGIMQRCGLSAAPADARTYVKEYADWISPSDGGKGAVRDFGDMILMAQGKWEPLMAKYLKGFENKY